MKQCTKKLPNRNGGPKPPGELSPNDKQMVSSNGWSVEIQRAEIQDWWEAERKRIVQDLPQRLSDLYDLIDQKVDSSSTLKLTVKKHKFLEKILSHWSLVGLKKITRNSMLTWKHLSNPPCPILKSKIQKRIAIGAYLNL